MTLIKLSKTNSLFSLAPYTNVNGIIPWFLASPPPPPPPPPLGPAAFVLHWSGLQPDGWIQLSSVIELAVQSRYKLALFPTLAIFHIKYIGCCKICNMQHNEKKIYLKIYLTTTLNKFLNATFELETIERKFIRQLTNYNFWSCLNEL